MLAQPVPKEMVFELHYLGSTEYSFSLNFSRPAAPIIGMYFNLVHLGFEGYRRIAIHDAKNARLLSRALEKSKCESFLYLFTWSGSEPGIFFENCRLRRRLQLAQARQDLRRRKSRAGRRREGARPQQSHRSVFSFSSLHSQDVS